MTNLLSGFGLISIYSVIVGLAILGLWIFLFSTNQVFTPSNPQKPIEIAYHVTAESLTATLLIASGIGLLADAHWAGILSPVALGMLLYTVINSAGFYANKGNLPMVVMFSILTIITIACIIVAIFRL